MLLIHKPRNHKLLILVITSVCCIGALLSLSALTYTPELSHAEAVTSNGLPSITYMQEMTAAICKASAENESKRLIDSRDGKHYWVTKLKDGNCWMTQNLDLDIPAEGLKAEDTDIVEDWDDSSDYKPTATKTDGPSGFNGSTVVASYDPGMYIYTKPTTKLSSGCGLLDSTTCQEAGWQNVQSIVSSNDPNFTEPFLSSDEAIYNAHYLVGNYYSFNAATAGKGATVTTSGSSVENDSICPKNWKLPLSHTNNNNNSGSFYYLLNKYGLTSSLASGNNDIRLAPLYFVSGGSVSNSSLYLAGSSGYYWSSTAVNASYAYYLYFDTSVNPSGTYSLSRYNGFSVRCVAR